MDNDLPDGEYRSPESLEYEQMLQRLIGQVFQGRPPKYVTQARSTAE